MENYSEILFEFSDKTFYIGDYLSNKLRDDNKGSYELLLLLRDLIYVGIYDSELSHKIIDIVNGLENDANTDSL